MYDYINYIESLGNTESSLLSALESYKFSNVELEQLSALESFINDIALEEDLPEVREELEEIIKEPNKNLSGKIKDVMDKIKKSIDIKDPIKRKKLIQRGIAVLSALVIIISSLLYHKKVINDKDFIISKITGDNDNLSLTNTQLSGKNNRLLGNNISLGKRNAKLERDLKEAITFRDKLITMLDAISQQLRLNTNVNINNTNMNS